MVDNNCRGSAKPTDTECTYNDFDEYGVICDCKPNWWCGPAPSIGVQTKLVVVHGYCLKVSDTIGICCADWEEDEEEVIAYPVMYGECE